jgi:hypothetical protein
MAKQTEAVNSPTPSEVWAYLQETGRQFREMGLKTDRQLEETRRLMEERAAKVDKQMEERAAKVDKQLEESRKVMEERAAKVDKQLEEMSRKVDAVSKDLGGLGNRLGDIVEGMLTSDLFKKFYMLGYDFDEAISNYEVCEKGTKRLLAEVDKLMFNGTIALAIEAKAQMDVYDVNQHLEQMLILQCAPNRLLNGKKLYGAMAGAKMTNKARDYAIEKGFFVIEASGDTVTIAVPEGKPAVWEKNDEARQAFRA